MCGRFNSEARPELATAPDITRCSRTRHAPCVDPAIVTVEATQEIIQHGDCQRTVRRGVEAEERRRSARRGGEARRDPEDRPGARAGAFGPGRAPAEARSA